jgi:hypothetical protein
MTKSATPCAFCGGTGSLSTEHVVPKWLRKALQISGPVKEYSDATYIGAAQTLAVFHEVCVGCNSEWLSNLETAVRPVQEPLLLGQRRALPVGWTRTSRQSWPRGR